MKQKSNNKTNNSTRITIWINTDLLTEIKERAKKEWLKYQTYLKQLLYKQINK